MDGQQVYLHPFNFKCLLRETGNRQDALPVHLSGPVVDMETLTIYSEFRRKNPFVAHLPLRSQITILELDLYDALSPETQARISFAEY